MQTKDIELSEILSNFQSFINTVLPQTCIISSITYLEPCHTYINEIDKSLQVPLTIKVDTSSSNDRNIVAQITPPYETNHQLLSDILIDYDEHIRQYEESMAELNQIFRIDKEKLVARYISQRVEESIDSQDKAKFYTDEVQYVFDEIINKDVERASLRMHESQIRSVHNYDLLTGELKGKQINQYLLGFRDEFSQHFLETQSEKQNPITLDELDNLVDAIIVQEEDLRIVDGIVDHQKQIFEFIESTKKYIKNPRTKEDEEMKDLDHINIDKVLQEKQIKAGLKQQQQYQQEKQTLVPQIKVEAEKNQIQQDKSFEEEDEIEFLVKDSQQFKKALEISQQTIKQESIVALKQDQEIIPQRMIWHHVDESDMRRFNEMIPNMAISYPFELDDFQKRAIYRMEQGHSVFVAAHTSAGKTVVAEYAIALSQRNLTKTVYTSPIKALSNQKYREFKEKFGDVGIKTGDITLNAKASCVIMTTEVLQKMLYEDSDYLKDVEWVIFDEVHYINDVVTLSLVLTQQERGSVWEEVIMKLPSHIKFVMLSATVPNYKEFADWVGRVKRKKIFVQMTEKRPVPLEHCIIYKDKLHKIKDEFGTVYGDQIDKVLRQIAEENRKKRYDQEKQKEEKKDGEEKKIDFKEKAIKAKEKMIDKVAAKGMKQESGSGDGPNSQAQSRKKYEKFHKYLITITREKLLPCIVFCFSRASCEEIPAQLDSHLEFTTGQEKGVIKSFLKQKLQRLSESDRKLPQIQSLKNLLVRGIGIHHAGLLPVVKELIEILFADGYLKVIFATTTFAIGLNLPARSVMFTQIMKFNGTEMELLQASEYLQMAGRAGRRGKDPKGTCLLAIDPSFGRIPEADNFKEILASRGTMLESKLKLSYQMTLDIVQQNDQHISDLIKSSFFENEQEKERAYAAKRAQQLQVKIQKASNLEDFERDDVIMYWEGMKRIMNLNKKIFTIARNDVVPLVIAGVFYPYLQNEFVVVLKDWREMPDRDEQYCLFISDNYQKRPVYLSQEDEEEESKGGQRSGYEDNTYYEYVWIKGEYINRITDQLINLNYKLQFNKNNELNQNVLREIISQFRNQVKLIKDWKMPNNANPYIEERKQIMKEVLSLPCSNSRLLTKALMQLSLIDLYKNEIESLKSLLQQTGQEKLKDFKAKIQMLIHYKYLDYDLNLLFRGKVAQYFIQVDKFLMTELIFSGILKDLTNEEVAAIFSVFDLQVRNNKYQDAEAPISENFQRAMVFIQQEAMKLIETESRFGVADTQSELSQRLNFCFYEIIYAWAKQVPFIEVVKLNTIDEGGIVKGVQNVERISRQVKSAARIIGDAILAQRMDEIQTLIKRDIIFTPSLYLE